MAHIFSAKGELLRAKLIVLTGLAAMLGASFILDDPIFNGLVISLIFGILVSILLTLIVIPELYYATLYKKCRGVFVYGARRHGCAVLKSFTLCASGVVPPHSK